MSKQIIVVTAAYGTQTVRQMGGQQALLDIIHESTADGVEIRQELLLEDDELHEISTNLQSRQLSAVYSVPDTLFHNRLLIEQQKLRCYLEQAQQLKARFLKLSLGDLPAHYDLNPLVHLLNDCSVQLVIENDQTHVGGHIAPLKRFFSDVSSQKLPIKMAFDIANWDWLNEDPLQAAHEFSSYVAYIHVKASYLRSDKRVAIPLDDSDGSWRNVLLALPSDVPRGIEFPLVSDELTAITKHYVSLLRGI